MTSSKSKFIQVVVLALIQKGDTFLFTLRHDPGSDYHNKWQIPGGGHEFGETPLQTLHREVREELGVEVEIIRLLPDIQTKVRNTWQGIFITYLCKLKDEQAAVILNDEASEYKWLRYEDLKHTKTLSGCVELIKSLS